MKRYIQDATRLAFARQRIITGRQRETASADEAVLLSEHRRVPQGAGPGPRNAERACRAERTDRADRLVPHLEQGRDHSDQARQDPEPPPR